MNSIVQFNKILNDFKIKATCTDAKQVDNYIYYNLKLYPNTRVKPLLGRPEGFSPLHLYMGAPQRYYAAVQHVQ